MKDALIGLFLGALIALAIMVAREAMAAERCPNDWHAPPCGDPPKVSQAKKDAAQRASDHFATSRNLFLALGAGACGLESQGWKPARLGCNTAKAIVVGMQIAKEDADKIVRDPYDPWFEYAYGGYFFSDDELGIADIPEDNETVARTKEHIRYVAFLGDYVGVSLDRAMSCYSDANGVSHLCYIWQQQRADDGIRWLGERYEALAYAVDDAADEMEPDIGQGVNPDLVEILRKLGDVLYSVGLEFQR